jgi:hypothetical protein
MHPCSSASNGIAAVRSLERGHKCPLIHSQIRVYRERKCETDQVPMMYLLEAEPGIVQALYPIQSVKEIIRWMV